MVSESKTPLCSICAVVLAVASVWSAGTVHAEDVVPARAQSDEQISVWANNATLELFVSQLAGMTGRRAAIEQGVEGRVSGRFNGTMVDALNAVSEQHQMLFDLDQNVLSVAAESARSSAIIPLSGSSIDDVLKSSMSSDGLTGNEIELRKDEVVVSGHPDFVKRVAGLVTTAVADAGQETDVQQAASERPASEALADPAAAMPAETESASTLDTASSEQVTDAAASIMIEQDAEASSRGSGSDTAGSAPRFRWVTDIPGYETF